MGKGGLGIFGVFVFWIAISLPFISLADESQDYELNQAVQEGIKAFIKDTPLTHLRQLGFKSREEAEQARPGDGFQINAIWEYIHLKNDFNLEELRPLAVPVDSWQFLILSQGNPKALLTVERVNHKWMAVSIGYRKLAEELFEAVKGYPCSSGYKAKILRLYNNRCDFCEITSEDKEFCVIVPLQSTRGEWVLKEKTSPLREQRK